jgi:hypothetical protein
LQRDPGNSLTMYFDAPNIFLVGGFEVMMDFFRFMQLAFTSLVYPALILGYMGQAAYLSQHHNFDSNHKIGFYISVPGSTHFLLSVTCRFF